MMIRKEMIILDWKKERNQKKRGHFAILSILPKLKRIGVEIDLRRERRAIDWVGN